MSCDKYLDLISAQLDGELTVREQTELTAHLQTCPACRAIARDMDGLHAALTEIGEVTAPAELSQTVLSKIKAERRTARRRLVRRLTGLAACLVLCVGVLRVTDAISSGEAEPATADGFSYAAQPETALADQAAPAEAAGQTTPAARATDEPKFKALPLSIDAYALSQTVIDFTPSARLLDSAAGLEKFLARFPNDDLSTVLQTYNEDFFLTRRLLAVVVQEPSSSVTHAVSQLTENSVTILRDTSVTGDNDCPRWLMLIPTELSGPERDFTVKLTDS